MRIKARENGGSNYTGSTDEKYFEIDDRKIIRDRSINSLDFKFPPIAGTKSTDPAYTSVAVSDPGAKYTASLTWIAETQNGKGGFGPDGETFVEGNAYAGVISFVAEPGYRISWNSSHFFRRGSWQVELAGNVEQMDVSSYGMNWSMIGEKEKELQPYTYFAVKAVNSADEAKIAKITAAFKSLYNLKEEPVSYDVVHDDASAEAYVKSLVLSLSEWSGATWTPSNCINAVPMRCGYTVDNGIIKFYLKMTESLSDGRIGISMNNFIHEFTGTRVSVNKLIEITPQGSPAKVSLSVKNGSVMGWFVNGIERLSERGGTARPISVDVTPGSDVLVRVHPADGYTLESWSNNVTNTSICGLSEFCGEVTAGAGGASPTAVEINLAPKSAAPWRDSVVLFLPFCRFWSERVIDEYGNVITVDTYERIKMINGGPDGTGTKVLEVDEDGYYGGLRVAKTDIIKMEVTTKTDDDIVKVRMWNDTGYASIKQPGYISGPLTMMRKFTRDTELDVEINRFDPSTAICVNFDPNEGVFKSGLSVFRLVENYGIALWDWELPNRKDLSRLGYTFMGWAESKTATEPDDGIKSQYYDNTTTLYAVWKDNKTLAREAAGKTKDISTSNHGPLANRTGEFTQSTNPKTGSIEWRLDLDPKDVSSAFRSAPTAASAETFITSVIVKAIQDAVREEVGTDEITITIADGTEDAESSVDLNGVAAASVAPSLSSLITRPNGEKGYEYTYWLKVKRNPFVYVGQFIVWLPISPEVIPPIPDNLTNDGFIYVDGKRVGTIIFNDAEIAYTPTGNLSIGLPIIQMDGGKSSTGYIISGITYVPAGGGNANSTVISNTALSSSASWNTGVDRNKATDGVVAGTYNVSVEVLKVTAPVAVVGKSRIVTFTINPRSISEASMTLQLTDQEKIYNGRAKSPRVSIKDGSYIVQRAYDDSKGDVDTSVQKLDVKFIGLVKKGCGR